MSRYNPIERNIAKFLDTFPGVKRFAKRAYQRFQFFMQKEKGFQSFIVPDAKMLNPWQWAGIPEQEGSFFFGYFDRTPWSADMGRLLLHQEISSDKIAIVIFDKNKRKFIKIAESKAFSRQQGTLACWLPGSSSRIIFNDFQNEALISRIIDVENGEEAFLPVPVQVIHPDGDLALTVNFKRLFEVHVEYGYAPEANNFSSDMPFENDGIWKLDLTPKKNELIISLKDLMSIENNELINSSPKHIVNHVMYSPKGTRCVFMHRWKGPKGMFSRLYALETANNKLKLLLDERMVSHYCWKDEIHLLVYARTPEKGDHYYMLNTITGDREVIGEGKLDLYGDGHPSFSPDGGFVLTDTYPDKARQQHLLLYQNSTGKMLEIGRFFSPWNFNEHNRCDLHPRWSPDGKMLSIDATFEGKRMSYIIDIKNIITSY